MSKHIIALFAALAFFFLPGAHAESALPYKLLNEDSVSLSLSSVEALPGDTICLEAKVDSNFAGLVTLQFTISWDTAQLEFVDAALNPTFPPNFISIPILGFDNTESGFLVMAWGLGDFDTYPNGISREPGYSILELCLVVRSNASGFLPVDFTNDIAIQEAANADLEVCNINFVGGGAQVPAAAGAVGMQVGEGRGPVGSTVCVPVLATDFSGICSLELGISWDNSKLQYAGVDSLGLPGLAESQFSFMNSNNLFLDWQCPGAGASLAAGDTLFLICYEVLGPAGAGCSLDFMGELTQASTTDGLLLVNDLRNGYFYLEGNDPATDLALAVQDTSVLEGNGVCLDVTVANFSAMTSMQLGMRWDTSRLHFESIEPGSLPGLNSSFNLATASEGYFLMAWFSGDLPAGTSLDDGALLFSICFTADTLRGPAAVSFSGIPLEIEMGGAQQPQPTIFGDGEVFVYDTEIWPGDTDNDGQVGAYDLLPIGLALGTTGPQRPGATTNWEGQLALSWPEPLPGSGINTVHSDTDGDGGVTAGDTLAISLNWGSEVPPQLPPKGEGRVVDIPILVRPDTLPAASLLAFDILLGTEAVPAEEAYGLAFILITDPALVAPTGAFILYEGSWLGSLQAGLLGMYRYAGASARMPMAMTRTDGNPASGFGIVARIYLPLRDDLPNGLLELPFTIEGVRLLNSQGEEISTISLSTTALIDNVVGIAEEPLAKQMDVFPVPARERVFLRAPGLRIQSAVLFGPNGQEMDAPLMDGSLSVRGLPAGLYQLRVQTEEGVAWKRVLVGE